MGKADPRPLGIVAGRQAMKLSLRQHAARIIAELTMQQDPYPEEYEPPKLIREYQDECGRTVQEVQARNSFDATRHLQGTTPEGDKTRTVTHTGRNRWTITNEDWNK
jgi:hypothetical protein